VDQRVKGQYAILDSDLGICFRVVDTNNFCFIHINNSNLNLYTCVAGGFNNYFSTGNGYVVAGDYVEVHAWGEFNRLFLNDVLLTTVRQPTHLAGDGVGIRIASSNTTGRIDNVQAWDDVASLYTDRPSWVYKGNDTYTADTYGAP
jgi:hypothetical protein